MKIIDISTARKSCEYLLKSRRESPIGGGNSTLRKKGTMPMIWSASMLVKWICNGRRNSSLPCICVIKILDDLLYPQRRTQVSRLKRQTDASFPLHNQPLLCMEDGYKHSQVDIQIRTPEGIVGEHIAHERGAIS
jgi:hypothetical protein